MNSLSGLDLQEAGQENEKQGEKKKQELTSFVYGFPRSKYINADKY